MAPRRRNTPGKGPVRPKQQQKKMRQKARQLGFTPSNKRVKSWAIEQGWEKPVQMGGVPIPKVPGYDINKAATNQVNMADQPILNEIAAQQRGAYDLWKEQDRGSRSIAQGAMNMFSRPGEIGRQFDNLGQTFNQNMQGVVGQQDDFDGGAGQDVPALAGEEMAQNQMMRGLGFNTHAALMGQAQTAVTNQRGLQDQFAVDLATRRANYLEDFQDQIQALREGRLDALKDNSMQILAQRNTLADQRFGQESARFGMGMDYETAQQDRDFAKALQRLIKKEMGRGGGGGGGGGGGRRRNQGGGGKGPGGPWPGPEGDRGTGTDPIPPGRKGKGHPIGPGYAREKAVRRYDRLSDRIQGAHEDIEGEWYDPVTKKWYVGGIPFLSTVGAKPVARINKPNRRRRRLVKKNPDLKGRANG